LVLLIGLVIAAGVIFYSRFTPGRVPTTVEVRNVGTEQLVVVVTPPGGAGFRSTVMPGQSCSAPFARGATLSVWIGPGDVGDPATWRIEQLAGPIEARVVGGSMEIAGDGLEVVPIPASP
jgi:hypothetical protein